MRSFSHVFCTFLSQLPASCLGGKVPDGHRAITGSCQQEAAVSGTYLRIRLWSSRAGSSSSGHRHRVPRQEKNSRHSCCRLHVSDTVFSRRCMVHSQGGATCSNMTREQQELSDRSELLPASGPISHVTPRHSYSK